MSVPFFLTFCFWKPNVTNYLEPWKTGFAVNANWFGLEVFFPLIFLFSCSSFVLLNQANSFYISVYVWCCIQFFVFLHSQAWNQTESTSCIGLETCRHGKIKSFQMKPPLFSCYIFQPELILFFMNSNSNKTGNIFLPVLSPHTSL